eukprot:6383237-Karenia_brevis.AAC.1
MVGIPPTCYHSLQAVREKGSLAECVFESTHKLAESKMRIRAAAITSLNASGPVWLDFKKTNDELRPGRVIRKAVNFLKDEVQLQNVSFTTEGSVKSLKIDGE